MDWTKTITVEMNTGEHETPEHDPEDYDDYSNSEID
jgi:hypothetical protein